MITNFQAATISGRTNQIALTTEKFDSFNSAIKCEHDKIKKINRNIIHDSNK
jgi:hypothetical protein